MPNKIAPTLKPGDAGPDVANLQEALRLLAARGKVVVKDAAAKEKLTAALAGEREQALFGEAGTLALVKLLQKQRKIKVTGVVDEPTAAAINKLLDGIEFSVRGRVRGAPADSIVRVYDKDLRSEEFLGERTLPRGAREYEVRYRPARFQRAEKASADLRVALCNRDGRELLSSAILFNAPEDSTIDLLLGGEERGRSEYERYLDDLKPVMQGLELTELDEKDLEFLAGDTQIARTHLAWLAQSAKLAAQLQRPQPQLGQALSMRARKRVYAPQCHTVPAAAFYALLRQGLPRSLAELAALEEKPVRDAVDASERDNIVPPLGAESITALLAALHERAVAQMLEPAAQNSKASLGDLLSPILPAEKQVVVAAAYRRILGEPGERRRAAESRDSVAAVETSGALDSLWQELERGGLSSGEIRDTQNAVALDQLTGGHAPLIRELMRDPPKGTAAMDPAALARLSEQDWLEVLERPRNPDDPDGARIGAPETYENDASYARALAGQVANAFPTQVMAHQIAQDGDGASPFLEHKADLATFFARNPGFELGTQPVDDYLREGADDKLAGVIRAGETRDALKRMERLGKFAPAYGAKVALLNDNVDSGLAAVRLGKENFRNRYREAFGGDDAAGEAYDRANEVVLRSLSLYLKFGMLANAPSAYVLKTGDGDAVDVSQFSEVERATWRTMFGGLETCACVHCQSLNSPAAYLVDLLAFLRQQNNEGMANPLDVLLQRRPDLAHLELTCDNTNLQLPYVDIANEILERVVAGRHEIVADVTAADLDGGTIVDEIQTGLSLTSAAKLSKVPGAAAWLIRDVGMRFVLSINEQRTGVDVLSYPQTTGTPAELGANPQHVHGPAYAILADAAYPWSLPFHFPVEQARVYLHQLGVERHEVMAALVAPATILSNDTIAVEELGLASLDAGIIVGNISRDPARRGAPTDAPWTFWGFSNANVFVPDPATAGAYLNGDWVEVLKRVGVLLAQSGMKYVDLLALLNTHFVNPQNSDGRPLHVTSTDAADPATCDPNKLEIRELDAAVLARIHRFERLRRRLGWSARDLDRAITAFDANALSAPLLRRLAHARRLMHALRCSLPDLLAFWSDIDTAYYSNVDASPGTPDRLTSKYDDLFRNKAIANPLDAAFTEDPAALTGTLADHIPMISSALRIGASDLALLCTGPGAVIANPALSLANLSTLFRHALLARGLRLSIADLLRAKALLGLDPFASSENTASFVERVTRIRGAGFDVKTLAYLLRHDLPDARIQADDDAQSAALLTQLRDGLRKVDQETVATEDPVGEVTRAKLALLRWNAAHIEPVVALLADSGAFEAPLTALPDGLEIPPEYAARVSYDVDAQRLRVRGVLSNDDRQNLRGLPAATNADRVPFQGAVEVIFNASRDAARALMKQRMRAFALPSFATPTDGSRLTLGFEIPERWKDRLDYDTQAGRLVAKVALSDADMAELRELSQDTAYQSALTALSAATLGFQPAPLNRFVILASGEADPAAFTDLFDSGLSSAERFAYVLARVCVYLRRTLREGLVNKTLSDALRLDAAAIEALLTRLLDAPSGAASSMDDLLAGNVIANGGVFAPTYFTAQFELLARLRKVAVFATRLRMTTQQVTDVGLLAGNAGWLDWNDLPTTTGADAVPFAAFDRLITALELRGKPLGEDAAFTLLRMANDTATSRSAFNTKLAKASDWALAEIEALAGSAAAPGLLGLQFPADYRDGRGIARLRDCFRLLGRLGASAAQLEQWAQPDLATPDPAATRWPRAMRNATALRNAVKAKYDASEWLTLARPLTDKLRDRQRAALVAYLVGQGDYGREETDLYERFLIDVEMCACMTTTRLKQALCSIQLFVQRCLMNLESDVRLTPEQAEQWHTWRKLYRVWEANRKVLLYPENWIEPELRDDKTPFFKQLESELLQNEVTSENGSQVVRNYLDRLHQVARLEVVGMCRQDGAAGSDGVLHVFGRTHAIPHVYFYRRLRGGLWSPWEKLDVDIEGDHLIPAVWNGHLYLFWPIFSEKTERPTEQQRADNEDPDKYLEIKLAWTELKQGKWLPRKLSRTVFKYVKNRSPLARQEPDTFKFLSQVQTGAFGSKLVIDCYGPVFNLVLPPPPPPEEPPLGDYLLVAASGLETAAIGFAVNGALPPADVLDTIEIVARKHADNSYMFTRKAQSLPWPDAPYVIGGIISLQWDATDYYVKQEKFKVKPPVLAAQPFGFKFAAVDLSPYHRATAVTDAPPKLPELVTTPMVARARFAFDDCNGDMIVTPVGQVTPAVGKLVPPLVGQTRYDGMTIVENDFRAEGFDPFGANNVMLARTPGTFRVLMRPESYAVNSLTVPFAYQDRQRSYMVDMVDAEGGYWGGKKLHFEPFYHAWTCQFIETLEAQGLPGFLSLANQTHPDEPSRFESLYGPKTSFIDLDLPADGTRRTPRQDVDFSDAGAYSRYNWELFFHIPLLIATQLTRNQRFEEARRWFHYIFDPTSSADGGRERFWKFKPFFDEAQRAPQTISDLIREESAALDRQIEEWQAHPFQPFVIARLRVLAFMRCVVMKYLENLIAWADQLFRRDTIESINEATQLYVLAANILGKRPETVPPRARAEVQTFATLGLGAAGGFLDALVRIESYVFPAAAPASMAMRGAVGALGTMPLFCIPPNDKLLGYWDTVAQRLFNIRHCMNIEGVVRELPIFEPPIDPALLVRAAALGVDLDSVLNDLYAPLPNYRFAVMRQKATELCADVKALGGALLAALEKKDAEELALLRSRHELEVLAAVRRVKELQRDEAGSALDGLNEYRKVVAARQEFYLSRPFLNQLESQHLLMSNLSLLPMQMQIMLEAMAGMLNLIPEVKTGAPTTLGLTYGGSNVAGGLQSFAGSLGVTASMMSTMGSLAATMGGHERRQDDWTHQADLATKELVQVDKQIVAAQIRRDIAEQELANHDMQREHSREVDAHLRDKYTNGELYGWMTGQIAGLYFQSYRLAYDVAKRAERAWRHELGIDDSNFIQFGYWDSLKKGLLAGERLQLDLARMDSEYLERNKREFEITKHVSMLALDPRALLQLRQTGRCELEVPEVLFDLDHPGHYLRRIKNVSITIPCVTGPYGGVNCTLTLLRSRLRRSASTTPGYAREEDEDARFTDSFGSIQSVVISSAQDDSGLFEPNLRDERFLPFEGAGVISTWRFELPDFRPFDYDTIADVILHVRYTARGGGGALKQACLDTMREELNEIKRASQQSGLVRLVSLRQEFPTEWQRLATSRDAAGDSSEEFALTQRRFPFALQRSTLSIVKVDLLLVPKSAVEDFEFPELDVMPPESQNALAMKEGASIGRMLVQTSPCQVEVSDDEEDARWTVSLHETAADAGSFRERVDDILVLCHYEVQ